MNKGVLIAIGIGLLIALGGGTIYLLGQQMMPESQLPYNPPAQNDTSSFLPPSQPSDTSDSSDSTDSTNTQTAGTYTDYDSALLANANSGDVVLFFHASWCPTCRVLSNDINANLSSIPSNLTILKTDYDTQTELKQKYGVTYQHTLVQVDASGNMLKKWSLSYSLDDLVSQVI